MKIEVEEVYKGKYKKSFSPKIFQELYDASRTCMFHNFVSRKTLDVCDSIIDLVNQPNIEKKIEHLSLVNIALLNGFVKYEDRKRIMIQTGVVVSRLYE